MSELWSQIVQDLEEFNEVVRVLERLERIRGEDLQKQIMPLLPLLKDIGYGEVYPHSIDSALHKWYVRQRPSNTAPAFELSEPRITIGDALMHPDGGMIWSVLGRGDEIGGWTLGTVLVGLRAMQKHLNRVFAQTAPVRFQRAGFEILNPDHLFESTLSPVLDGVDRSRYLFRERGVDKIIEKTVSSVEIRLSVSSDVTHTGTGAAGWHNQNTRKITLVTDHIHGFDDVLRVFVHEVGHSFHTVMMSPDAKREWDNAWFNIPTDDFREEWRGENSLTLRDRERLWEMLRRVDFDPKKMYRKLKNPDKKKFLGWLYSYGTGPLISTPSQLRLTSHGKLVFETFREHGDDPDMVDHHTDRRRVKVYRSNLWLNDSTPIPFGSATPEDEHVAVVTKQQEYLKEMGVPNDYARTNLHEDFAESFRLFMLHPDQLHPNAKYRVQRALSLSGLYGKPLMRLAGVRIEEPSIRLAKQVALTWRVANRVGARKRKPSIDSVDPAARRRASRNRRDKFVEYYRLKPRTSVREVVRRWVEEVEKPYDPHVQMYSLREVWPHREYTWSADETRDGQWDSIVAFLSRKGWDPKEPAILIVGSDGSTKLGEGNHRLAAARELGIRQIPMRFLFVEGRVSKNPQRGYGESLKKAPKPKSRPQPSRRTKPRTEEDERKTDELMDLIFSV